MKNRVNSEQYGHREKQKRGLSAGRFQAQADLVCLRTNQIGTGNIGGMIAEVSEKADLESIMLIGFRIIGKSN